MKDMGTQQGSAEWALPVIVKDNVVYVHSDIEKLETEDGSDVYQYHEIQYGAQEYIELQGTQLEAMSVQLTDAQLALAELYEIMV